MATTPIWVPLVIAFIGLGGVMLTQYWASRREDTRWRREREHEQARWAHEDNVRSNERTYQRLADSYLEVLRLVERKGQWIEVHITNFMLAVADQDDNSPYRAADFQWVEMPPEPAATDRATIAAHLAFGSPNVRRLYEDWRSTLTKIDIEEDGIRRAFDDISGKGPNLDALKELEVLQPKERDARQALADAIAKELGPHR
jgi:hypothetical protein